MVVRLELMPNGGRLDLRKCDKSTNLDIDQRCKLLVSLNYAIICFFF